MGQPILILPNKAPLSSQRHALEKPLLEHGHGRHDARPAARVELVQLHVARDELGNKLGVCCCSRTAAPNIVGDIVNLLGVGRREMKNVNTQLAHNTSQLVDSHKRTFSQFLSATMGPSVARVSAPSTMPSLNAQPTMVVPVLVAFGSRSPFCVLRWALRLCRPKSKPLVDGDSRDDAAMMGRSPKRGGLCEQVLVRLALCQYATTKRMRLL